MSPFIIFVIVLTIAYVLYYATIITMDLNGHSNNSPWIKSIVRS